MKKFKLKEAYPFRILTINAPSGSAITFIKSGPAAVVTDEDAAYLKEYHKKQVEEISIVDKILPKAPEPKPAETVKLKKQGLKLPFTK